MLVLSRDAKQSINIDGGKIVVTVLEVKGGRVKLGIEADASISVKRTEVSETGSESK